MGRGEMVRTFAPAALLTRPRKPVSVLGALGDSIINGIGEDTAVSNARWDEGWCTRAVRDDWPHFVVSQSGTTLEKWYSNGGLGSFYRKSVLAGVHFTPALCELGVNDIVGGASLATMQQRWWTTWEQLVAYGRPVLQSTITPATTTSTDQWTTVAGQTINAAAAATLASGDTWLRDGAPWNINHNQPAVAGASGTNIVRAGEYRTNVAGVATRTAFTTRPAMRFRRYWRCPTPSSPHVAQANGKPCRAHGSSPTRRSLQVKPHSL